MADKKKLKVPVKKEPEKKPEPVVPQTVNVSGDPVGRKKKYPAGTVVIDGAVQ